MKMWQRYSINLKHIFFYLTFFGALQSQILFNGKVWLVVSIYLKRFFFWAQLWDFFLYHVLFYKVRAYALFFKAENYTAKLLNLLFYFRLVADMETLTTENEVNNKLKFFDVCKERQS